MRRLFALPGFGRLSVAYALNELAWYVGTLSLSVLIYRRTGSTIGSAGFFLCSQGVPALFAPVIVGRLDRASPRRLLPSLYGAEAILFIVLAWLTDRFTLGPVLAIVVVDGVVALTARSLSNGARTEILKPVGLVREGGAAVSMMFSVAYLIGPLTGGAVAAAGGTVTALVVSGVMFAVIAVSLISRTIPASIVHDGPATGRLRSGLAYVRSNRAVADLLTIQTIAVACFSIATPIEVVFCVHTLHAGSAGYGGLLATWGGGAVLGSLAYTRLRHRAMRDLMLPAAVSLAIGYAVLAISPDLAVALLGAAFAGIGNGVIAAGFGTELMAITPQSWVALVSSVNQSLGVVAPGAGIVLGGVLASVVDVRATFGIAAAASLVVAALIGRMLAPARLAVAEARARDEGQEGEVSLAPEADTPTLA